MLESTAMHATQELVLCVCDCQAKLLCSLAGPEWL